MNKQKRMVYIYEENLAYYDSLKNKSQFINDALQDARIDTRIKAPQGVADPAAFDPNHVDNPQYAAPVDPGEPIQPEELDLDNPAHPQYHADPRIRETRKQLADMEKRDREALGQ